MVEKLIDKILIDWLIDWFLIPTQAEYTEECEHFGNG